MTSVTLRLGAVGLACVQDLGRPGLAHLGIPANGAADGWAARVANVLVGNPVDAPLLEITGSELTLDADTDLLLAVTGAADHVLVAGAPQPVWETLVVPAGWSVTVPAPERGLRSYLAVHGRLAAERVLGSVAPDRLLGVGRWLRPSEIVRIETGFAGLDHPYARVPLFRLGATAVPVPSPLVVETTRGPDAGDFPGYADGTIEGAYEVSPRSDGIGLRLLGPTPARSGWGEILSRGVPVGAVEVPPAGGLLVLLRGRLVTAGYPVLAVATLDSVDRLRQARPGDRIRFSLVDTDRAREQHRQRHRKLVALQARVATAFAAAGLGALLSPPRTPCLYST